MTESRVKRLHDLSVRQMDNADEIFEIVKQLGKVAAEMKDEDLQSELATAMNRLLNTANEIVDNANRSVKTLMEGG